MSGLLFAEGWAANASRPESLLALTPEAGHDLRGLDYGRPRPDLASECGSLGGSPCGFELAAQLTPEAVGALRQRGVMDLQAVMADGRVARTEMPLSEVRVLGDLSGREWSDLNREVAEAEALGASDRKRGQARVAASR
jgi:hypothetical protein